MITQLTFSFLSRNYIKRGSRVSAKASRLQKTQRIVFHLRRYVHCFTRRWASKIKKLNALKFDALRVSTACIFCPKTFRQKHCWAQCTFLALIAIKKSIRSETFWANPKQITLNFMFFNFFLYRELEAQLERTSAVKNWQFKKCI